MRKAARNDRSRCAFASPFLAAFDIMDLDLAGSALPPAVNPERVELATRLPFARAPEQTAPWMHV